MRTAGRRGAGPVPIRTARSIRHRIRAGQALDVVGSPAEHRRGAQYGRDSRGCRGRAVQPRGCRQVDHGQGPPDGVGTHSWLHGVRRSWRGRDSPAAGRLPGCRRRRYQCASAMRYLRRARLHGGYRGRPVPAGHRLQAPRCVAGRALPADGRGGRGPACGTRGDTVHRARDHHRLHRVRSGRPGE